MSEKKYSSKNSGSGTSGREGLFILGVIALAVIAMIVIGTLNDKSPVSGVKRSIYDTAVGTIEILDSEYVLNQARDGENAVQMQTTDKEYINFTAFNALLTERYDAENNNDTSKYTKNARTYLDTVGTVWQTQDSEAVMISLQQQAEVDPTLLDSIEGLADVQSVIDIYEKIWREGLTAAKSNDIKEMRTYLDDKTVEYGTELEQYQDFITTVSAIMQELEAQSSTDYDEILGNADPSMFE